jgi:hypothetical protein
VKGERVRALKGPALALGWALFLVQELCLTGNPGARDQLKEHCLTSPASNYVVSIQQASKSWQPQKVLPGRLLQSGRGRGLGEVRRQRETLNPLEYLQLICHRTRRYCEMKDALEAKAMETSILEALDFAFNVDENGPRASQDLQFEVLGLSNLHPTTLLQVGIGPDPA